MKENKVWRGEENYTREDYRQFQIDLNAEFDMEEAFNKIEAGRIIKLKPGQNV